MSIFNKIVSFHSFWLYDSNVHYDFTFMFYVKILPLCLNIQFYLEFQITYRCITLNFFVWIYSN